MKYSLLKRDPATLTEEEKDLYYEQLKAWTKEMQEKTERLELCIKDIDAYMAKYGNEVLEK